MWNDFHEIRRQSMVVCKKLSFIGMFLISFSLTAQYFPCAKRVNNCKSRTTYIIQCEIPFDTENGTVECVSEAVDQVSCFITDFDSLIASFTKIPTKEALYEAFAEQCFILFECSEKFQCRKVKAEE